MASASKGAVRSHHTSTSRGDWDGPETETRLPNDAGPRTLKKVFAWVDPEKPESETAAKFPHHEVNARGKIGGANVKACVSGIGILNGARGGAEIPSIDREPIYRHLATHLRDAGQEPPELR